MKRRISKILTLAVMCMLFATTAMAAKKDFSFSLISKGGNAYTAKNAKSDSEAYAYVTVDSANLISGDKVLYIVSNSAKTADVSAGATYLGINKPYKQTLKYKSGYAVKGKEYRLRIHTYNYSLQISGKWNS